MSILRQPVHNPLVHNPSDIRIDQVNQLRGGQPARNFFGLRVREMCPEMQKNGSL